jgi:hypothetical protein
METAVFNTETRASEPEVLADEVEIEAGKP